MTVNQRIVGSSRQAALLVILIPAILHGLYDTLGWSIPGLIVPYLGVTLLVIYLKNAKDFKSIIVK